MKSFNNLIALALLLIAATPPTVATATPATSTTTFTFSGLCDDCAGALIGTGPFHARNDGIYQSVTGTLVLQNFVPGAPLNISNFSSFTYNGSSILAPFTLNSSQNTTENVQLSGTLSASGTLQSPFFTLDWNQPSPGLATTLPGVFLNCSLCVFGVSSTGNWLLGLEPGDEGINGAFSLAAVPEPSSLAILGFALAGLAVMRRRRST